MHNEQVFTPKDVVNKMLDCIRYCQTSDSLTQNIMDNSCGDGAFLSEIVVRYIIRAYYVGYTKEEISILLGEHIHGIEIDKDLYDKCIKRLNEITDKEDIPRVKWNIINGDTLEVYKRYSDKMDVVIGNPPYCNVHHFGENYDRYKKFSFLKNGMGDLYMVFFEIGLNMLNADGTLIYITPSSWTTSLNGGIMRKHLIENNLFDGYINIGHRKVFKNVTTFTAITILSKDSYGKTMNTVKVYNYDIMLSIELKPSEYYVNGKFYLNSDSEDIHKLFDIINYSGKRFVQVKNGLATLNDKLFIHDIITQDFSEYIIPCIKASTGEIKQIIYPYNQITGKPYYFEELDDATKSHLLEYANETNTNTEMQNWYLYGRTQAIKDVSKNKISISNLLKNVDSVYLTYSQKGTAVYSGLYIVGNEESYDCCYGNKIHDFIYKVLKNQSFVDYIKSIGKYKNGGFYTFSSKDLEKYLNYSIKNNFFM